MNYELKTLVSENEEVSTTKAENYFHNKGYKLIHPTWDEQRRRFYGLFLEDYFPTTSVFEEELEHMRRIYQDGFKVWRILEGLYDEKEKDPYKDLMI